MIIFSAATTNSQMSSILLVCLIEKADFLWWLLIYQIRYSLPLTCALTLPNLDRNFDVDWEQCNKTISSGRSSCVGTCDWQRIEENPKLLQLSDSRLCFCACGGHSCWIMLDSCWVAYSLKMGEVNSDVFGTSIWHFSCRSFIFYFAAINCSVMVVGGTVDLTVLKFVVKLGPQNLILRCCDVRGSTVLRYVLYSPVQINYFLIGA